MKTARKKSRPGLAPEAAQCSRTCVTRTFCKIIIPRSTENASPNSPGREVPSLSGVELGFVIIGVGWLVGRGFRIIEAIDSTKGAGLRCRRSAKRG